ncbi:Nn.00g073080.m01.CDS01 [Neocucurbitaria sp. VM-36]
MALNWDAFLNTESLNIPHDQWSDLPPPQTAHHASQMPKSISTDTSGSTPEDATHLDSLLNASSADPYFDDSLFISNDYFLSDMEVLQPFTNNVGGGESTTESSPEPTTAVSSQSASQTPASLVNGLNQSPQMSPAQRQALQRASTFPNPAYESMFPNPLDHGFVQDLTFPDGPKGLSTTSRPGLDRTSSSVSTTVKRNKNKPDILSACWTSPLCPNHDQEGTPPNPSTCGGGCAPFLFADQDTLPTPTINNLLAEPQEVTAEDGVVEIQPRPKKRSESDASSNGFSGRQFTSKNTTTSPTDSRQRMKSETSEDSPAKESPQANEDQQQPKSRRRLPHNQVERKYRESLNTQLDSLRRVVPSLQQGQRACDGADIEDLPTPSKPSKAVILASATAYIKQMEKDKKTLADENQLLRTRVKALQALVKCDDCSLMQYVMDLKIKQAS